jgi:hypothetical protein
MVETYFKNEQRQNPIKGSEHENKRKMPKKKTNQVRKEVMQK